MNKHSIGFIVLGCSLVLAGNAGARELDAEETDALLSRGTWQIQTGGEVNYFLWKSDGSLCVKMYDPKAEKCDDLGTWNREGNKVCYKLPWWGKGVGIHDLCFQVDEGEEGKYTAMDDLGLPALNFTMQNVK